MENPCHRCGTLVQEGIAFCPQCNAPQIRVAVAESLAPPRSNSGPEAAAPSYPYLVPTLSSRIDWAQALPATALAGMIAAVLMMTPLAAFGVGMLIGGSLSVVFYRRRNPVANITPGMGWRLGMASGVLGSCIFSVIVCVQVFLRNEWGEIRQRVLEVVEQAARNPDAQTQQALEYFRTDQGVALIMTTGLVITLVALVILSSLGGALGAALLRRKQRL